MPHPPYHRFAEFIAPDADRLEIILSLLNELNLSYTTINIAGNSHVFLGASEVKVTLVAHYDRVNGSPGANDNSAAVFLLIDAAMRLRRRSGWRIIFTDGEELSSGEGARDQGAYTLAKALRDSGSGGGHFFIFDACGSGDTLIISTMANHVVKNGKSFRVARLRRETQILRDRALKTARNLMMNKVLLAPVPFSDDLGFLRAGITAQTITVLPSREAAALAFNLHKPGFADSLINEGAQSPRLKRLIPETWKTLNSPRDLPDRLTPRYYPMVVNFACALCKREEIKGFFQ
jgi:hypothetical protein